MVCMYSGALIYHCSMENKGRTTQGPDPICSHQPPPPPPPYLFVDG